MLPVTVLTPRSYANVLLLLLPLGFFNNGLFSGFPFYLPELYPMRLLATGAGFCFNVGRVLASAGPFLTWFLVTALGGFGRAASAIALIYLMGLAILPFAPETKSQPLQEYWTRWRALSRSFLRWRLPPWRVWRVRLPWHFQGAERELFPVMERALALGALVILGEALEKATQTKAGRPSHNGPNQPTDLDLWAT